VPNTEVAAGFVFPESPRWRNGWLYLSDMHGHQVLRVNCATGRKEILASLSDKPSGLGFLPDGRLIAVLMRQRRLIIVDGAQLADYCDLSLQPGQFLNDMVASADGMLYVGCVHFNSSAPRPSGTPLDTDYIIGVDVSARPRVVAESLSNPNGMVISANGSRLIVAESGINRLTIYDRDLQNGDLTNRRVFADLGSIRCDGIALDSDGLIWVGTLDRGEFVRVAEGGEIKQVLRLTKPRWAVACAVGGDDGKTLYMATGEQSWDDIRQLTDFEKESLSTGKGYVECAAI